VRIVEGNTVLTTSRQALSALLLGIAVFTLFQLTAVLIVVSLLFTAMVQERWREVGLLRAMGAKPSQIMTVILGEAAIITGLGGLARLIFGAAMLLSFARSLGFLLWPPWHPVLLAAIRDPGDGRRRGDRLLGGPRSGRRLRPGLAGPSDGAVRANSGGSTLI
jgi:putative ABC transport system permease protein